MRLSEVDLDLLLVLDAIYSEGGVTRAGKRLNLTQPAVSHALNRLREMFDDPLFVREGRGLAPTPLTRGLIQPLRRALRNLETVLNEPQRFDPAASQRQFTVATRDVSEATMLYGLLPRLDASAPAVDLSTTYVDRREVESELASGGVDAAFDVMLSLSDEIRRLKIASERIVVVVRDGHPLTRRPATLAEYLKHDHILVSSRRTGPGIHDIELNRHGRQRRIRVRCQQYFSACRVVSKTDLVLTMTGHYANVLSQQLGLRILPFPLEIAPLDLYLYWHANVDADPANRWLREQLIAAFVDL